MAKAAAKILSIFGIYLIIFILMKCVFMVFYHTLIDAESLSEYFDAIYHGFAMDCSVAGYFTLLPALIVTISTICSGKATDLALKIYTGISAVIISLSCILDLILYDYWNFRLDVTPFFYFFSSPSSAMASADIASGIIAIAAFIVFAVAIYILFAFTALRIKIKKSHKIIPFVVSLLLTAALFIPIRGSLTVSTMNLSRSYFSENQRLNHAAINPLFSLMYSATHQTDFSSQFQYYTSDEAENIISNLYLSTANYHDSIQPLLKIEHPDIYIIILESFSAHLLPSLGGEDIASRLDSIAGTGLLFSNFYASGARTDRAIPAILSAFPAQPTTSLMKYTRKIEHTPSLPLRLKTDGGYNLSYYYGGDANFTNMLAYLVSSGFDKIVSDKDFPISKRTSKWGAHDDVVFDRLWNDIKESADGEPALRVIQTSSSHEPFEVPYSDPRFADDSRKNAFAYADQCVAGFVDSLYASPRWDNSLVIITADHYGVYPRHIDDLGERHHIPLIITGGVLNSGPSVIESYGDQTAIASTLLSALGISTNGFKFSRNLFDNGQTQFAFYTEPGIAGYADADGSVAINLDNETIISQTGEKADSAAIRCKAILQTVYTTLSEL